MPKQHHRQLAQEKSEPKRKETAEEEKKIEMLYYLFGYFAKHKAELVNKQSTVINMQKKVTGTSSSSQGRSEEKSLEGYREKYKNRKDTRLLLAKLRVIGWENYLPKEQGRKNYCEERLTRLYCMSEWNSYHSQTHISKNICQSVHNSQRKNCNNLPMDSCGCKGHIGHNNARSTMLMFSTCLEEILGFSYILVNHINNIRTVPMPKWNAVMVIGNGYTFRTCNDQSLFEILKLPYSTR